MLRISIPTTAALVVALALFASAANAVSVDGVVTSGEYTIQKSLGFWVDVKTEVQALDKNGNPEWNKDGSPKMKQVNVPTFMPEASLWLAQTAGGDVCVAFALDRSVVDNSYGNTAIGWGSDAPSGKHHNFEDLVGSDKARFVFQDTGGAVLFDVTMDYLHGLGSKKENPPYIGGVTGGDFRITTGNVGDVLGSSTSLVYNWDTFGSTYPSFFGQGSNSPAADADYGNPTVPGWLYDVVYEFKIAGSVFNGHTIDISSDSFLTIPEVHASPNKQGDNSLTDFTVLPPPEEAPDVVVPEPLTVIGVLAGLCGMGGYIRKRRIA